mmetsp:Transcript_35125/g.92209  ORF Transcript_35125/g.92209 Transcript_35125/m.92209 type:complete len:740 (-) Transcript_35125:30-2249(-)
MVFTAAAFLLALSAAELNAPAQIVDIDARRELVAPEPEPSTGSPPPTPPAPPPSPAPPPLIVHNCAAAFGTTPVVETINLPKDTLDNARALDFNPALAGELWLADAGRSSLARIRLSEQTLAGASTEVGLSEVTLVKDRAEYHYLPEISSIAFDPLGQFATCQESANTYKGQMLANFFMGPTMYDTRERGWANSKQEACIEGDTCFLIHVDMLHEAPLCMGIVHDNAPEWRHPLNGAAYRNVYWAVGGGDGQLLRFDFQSDHGPGSMDHSLAEVRRYSGLRLTRVDGVPSQLAIDESTRELFVADSGGDRVVRVLLESGSYARDAKLNTSTHAAYSVYSSPEPQFTYSVWDGLQFDTFAAVSRPSGIAVSPTTVYVGSYSDGTIHAFLRSNGHQLQVISALVLPNTLTGLTLETNYTDAEGTLYFTAGAQLKRVRVPSLDGSACMSGMAHDDGCADGIRNGEESGVDCGGRLCARCAVGQVCSADSDCATSNCTTAGLCGVAEVFEHSPEHLEAYLNSAFYQQSFLHHGIHRDTMGASYLNPYPIMEPDFCDEVGNPNATLGRGPDCNTIDYDALLLGGCFCHPCLLAVENSCQNAGVCRNYNNRGYTCDCAATGFVGDHCQFAADVPRAPCEANLSSAFPWYQYCTGTLPPPPPPLPLAPVSTPLLSSSDDNQLMIILLAAAGGIALLAAAAIGAYLLHSMRMAPVGTPGELAFPKSISTSTKHSSATAESLTDVAIG